jgi:LPXTG-site transpeptidase (sortase) family protein
MKRLTYIFAIGLAVLISSFLLLTLYVRNNVSSIQVSPNVSAAAPIISHSPSVVTGGPVRFQVPSLNMDLPVINGYYDSNSGAWTLTKNKVQYAAITPAPNNESGNTFLYGHYRKQVFARLHTIQPQSQAIVTTDNGHKFYYVLQNVETVSPADSAAVFNYQGAPILTVQTCTGLFFQDRQLFTFKLERVE